MTLNDFKAVEGDRQMGVNSLPVMLGVDSAAHTACRVMIVPQLVVIMMLFSWGKVVQALVVIMLVLGQLQLMQYFVASPTERAIKLSAFGVPLLVAGMMVSAFALRSLMG
jgi:chlorophyll synthase